MSGLQEMITWDLCDAEEVTGFVSTGGRDHCSCGESV